jgi:hypothetical protein
METDDMHSGINSPDSKVFINQEIVHHANLIFG